MITAADQGRSRPRGSWRGLARGAAVGLGLSGLVLIGLSLTQPLPDNLPGIGGPTVEPTLPGGVTAESQSVSPPAPQGATLTPTPLDATSAPTSQGVSQSDIADGEPLSGAPTALAPATPDSLPVNRPEGGAAPSLTDPASVAPGLAVSEPGDAAASSNPAASAADLAVEVLLPPRSETAPVLSDAAQAALNAIGGPARQRNAARDTVGGDLPLIAVILDDSSGAGLPIEALLALEMPITLGIVPGRGADTALARAARAAGVEVLAQLPVGSVEAQGLLPGMAPEEITTRVATMLARLNLAASAAPFGPVGGETAGVVVRLKAEQARWGFADPTDADGRLGVEVTIPLGVTTNQGYRLLDTAAREAQARGAAIVRAPASRPMLEALLLWGLERGGRAARLAPLSAVLDRRVPG